MKTRGKFLGVALSIAGLAAALLVYAARQNTKGNGEGMTIAAGGPVVLSNEPAQVVLEGRSLAPLVGTLSQNHRIYLVFREQRAAEPPGVLYHIYLNLPAGTRPEKDDPHYVGPLNFYNAVPPEGGTATSNSGLFRSYDVTALLKNLQQQKALGDQTTVTIIPSGVPASGAKASIGRIEIVEQ